MLLAIPTTNHLARAYYELAMAGAPCEGEKRPWPYKPKTAEELFCLAADMSRYDPRLFSILVRFLNERWPELNPQKIRSFYKKMKTPQAVALTAEFNIGTTGRGDEFRFYLNYLQSGLEPVKLQFYFQHLYKPGGYLAALATEEALSEYKRWGFLAREAPILDDAHRRPTGTQDAPTRKNILIKLLSKRGSVSLRDYMAALDFPISRQQALLDMRSIENVKGIGHGRGARWKLAG